MHLQVKKLKVDIFTHARRHGKLSPMFLSSPSGRKKLLIPPRQRFFENLFPHAERGVGRENYRQRTVFYSTYLQAKKNYLATPN